MVGFMVGLNRGARILKTLVLLALVQGLAACSTYSLEELRHTTPKGTPFQASLALNYLKYSQEEADYYDWVDSGYFADKGLIAAYGEDVSPEELGSWAIPEEYLPALTEARAQLMAALTPEAKEAHPQEAANAQYFFDCWVENQDETWQPDQIAYCRDNFQQAIAALTAAPPIAAGDMPAVEKEAYIVYFGLNKAELDTNSGSVVSAVVEDLKKHPDQEYSVVINGHTDRVGAKRYNSELSHKRAETVLEALVGQGIPRMLVRAFGFGETDPKVETKDGVAEPKNRRVEIFINGD